MYRYFPHVVSVLAIIISITALANMCPRFSSFDYLGLIVGILTLLVTLLLGWQIYNAVDIRNNLNKLNKQCEDLNINIQANQTNVDSKTTALEKETSELRTQLEKEISELRTRLENLIDAKVSNFEVLGRIYMSSAHAQRGSTNLANSYFNYIKALDFFAQEDVWKYTKDIITILDNLDQILKIFERGGNNLRSEIDDLINTAELFSRISINLKKAQKELNFLSEQFENIRERHQNLI